MRTPRVVLGAAALLAAGVVASCDSPTRPPTEGAIAPRIMLIRDSSQRLTLPLTSVRATVSGPTNRIVDLVLQGGSWTGQATELNPGTYTVTIEGIAAGQVQFFGNAASVNVVAGQTAQPAVPFASAVPVITAPGLATTTAFTQNISFSAIGAATAYTVEASKSNTFASGVITQSSTSTTVAITVNDIGTWFLRARPTLPGTGSQVAWSDPQQFTVISDAGGRTSGSASAVGLSSTVPDTIRNRNITPTEREGWFSIAARAGDSLFAETFAARLSPASSLNTTITLYRADGTTEIATNDNITGSNDSRVVAVVPATEAYRVKVSGVGTTVGHYELILELRRLPAVPTSLTGVAASGSSVDLAWTDNADNEASVRIERCAGVGCSTFAEIASTAVDVTTFNDVGLTANESYSYRIRSRNSVGNSAYTAPVTVVIAGPAAPTALGATTISGTQIDLSWTDNSNNETGFSIERCSGAACSSFAQVGTVGPNITAYANTGLAIDQSYSFRVRALNAVAASAYSNNVTATTLRPTAPSALATTMLSGTRASLAWTDNASIESGFLVERCLGAGCSSFAQVASLAADVTTFTDSTLVAASIYGFRVRAFNAAGNSAYSNTATADTRAPGPPASLIAATVSGTRIDLTWTDTSATETQFRIERCVGAACSDFAEIAAVGANVTSHADSSAVISTAYRYRVRSSGVTGNSGYSNEVTASTLLPTAPSSFSASTISGTQVNLTWTDNSDNETSFRIERCQGIACSIFTEIASVSANAVAYSDVSVTAGNFYNYRIRARNGVGNSAYASIGSASTETSAAPTLLSAAAVSTTSVQLNWTDNAGNETGFRIERCAGAGCSDFVEITTVGANVTSYLNTAVGSGTAYSYRVRSYNIVAASAYTNVASTLTSEPTAPTAPATVTLSPTRVSLTWTDASGNEDGFRVERCTGDACTDFAEIGSVAANVVVYIDSTLTAETGYRYRIRGFNAVGLGLYSIPVAGETRAPAAPSAPTSTAVSGTRINLFWTDNSTNELGFEVDRCLGAGCVAFALLDTVTASSFVDSTVTVDQQYEYRVRAVNNAGASAYTSSVPANTLLSIPASDLFLTTLSATRISLAWTDNSVDETSFLVERCSGVACSDFAEIGTVSTDIVVYIDSTVSLGNSYSYRVRTTNFAGSSTPTAAATATTIVPDAPTGLTATTQSDTRIDLSWTDASTVETGFAVERCEGVGCTDFAAVGTAAANAVGYSDLGLTPAASYTYRVRATSASGASAYSNEATATTNLPAIPTGLTAVATTTTRIDLAWTDVASDETGYKVERCTGIGCVDFVEILDLPANTIGVGDEPVTAALTYRYRVRAYNAAGNSDYSNIALVTAATPVAPTGLIAATLSTTQIDLAWADQSDNETGFEIERCEGAACAGFTALATVGSNVVTYSDLSVTAGIIYRYQVRAVNAIGPSGYSAPAESNTILPLAPSALAAVTFSVSQINLSWTDNADNETSVRVERCVGDACTSFVQIAQLAANITAFSDTGLAANVMHRYRVRAGNDAGFSGYSAIAQAATDLPADPTGLTAVAMSNTQIDLAWTDQSVNETGFVVERCLGAACSDFAVMALLGANVVVFADPGLDPAQSYSYRVQAVNIAGASRYSNIAFARTSAPSGPVNLSATTIEGTRVNLAWDDDSDNELGFRIERCAGDACVDFLEIAVTTANIVSHQDSTALLNQTYNYRIRSYNNVGTSAYSLTATASTLLPALSSGLSATTISATQIDLAWIDQSDNETGFLVERCAGAGCVDYTELLTLPANSTAHADGTVVAETVYRYRVGPFNAAGVAGFDGPVEASTEIPLTPGSIGAAVITASRIDVTWSDLSNNEQDFRVERCTGLGCSAFSEIATLPPNSVAYSNTGLTQNTFYSYRVRATNAAGVSAYTSVFPVNTFLPAAPTGLTATQVLGNRVDLAWTDNANNESQFLVERCTGVTCVDFVQVATVGVNSVTHADSTLSFGLTYRFRVRASNGVGNSGYTAIATGSTNVPLDPTALSAVTTAADQIDLNWTDNATTEVGFRVERCTGAACTDFTEIGTVLANVTVYVDGSLPPGVAYRYRVRAYSVGSSGYSNTAAATTILPAAPTLLGATSRSGSRIDLDWTDNADNEYGHRVERCAGAGCSDFVEVADIGANIVLHEDSLLTVNTFYRYRARAYNGAGSSAYSNIAEAETNVPGIPTGLIATTISASQINLAWTDNAIGETGYSVERCVGAGCTDFAEVSTEAADAVSFSDVALAASTTFRYRVRAVNASGASGPSNVASASTNAPDDPTVLVATTVSGSLVELNWVDNANNEANYVIERCAGAGCVAFAELVTIGTNSVSYSDASAIVENEYRYRVRAVNAAGVSNYSNIADASTRTPAAPTALSATTISATRIDLAWTDNADNEASFRVERCVGPGCLDFAEIATLIPNTVAYQDEGLSSGASYTYRVRAMNVSGASGFTTVATAGTDFPADPSAFVATTISDAQIDLVWQDNSGNETQFAIERCVNADCGTSTYAPLATVGANTTTYSDLSVSLGNSYGYRLSASNAAGTSGSTSASATTLIPAIPSTLTSALVSATQIDLSWTDVSDNELSFEIERCTGACTDFAFLASVGEGVIAYADLTATAGLEFRYRVRAVNNAGASGYSGEVSETTVAPAAPTTLSATTLSSSQIQLAWTDLATNERGYRIESCTNLACVDFAEIDTVGADEVSYQVGGLIIGNVYRFRVRAYNGVDVSAYSNEASATTLLPDDPTGAVATTLSASEISLTWTDVADNEDSYRIERCTGVACSSFVEIVSLPANTTSHLNTGLTLNSAYRYRVRAFNAVGASEYTSIAAANTFLPTQPLSFSATTVTGQSISLSWADADFEEGYQIVACAGAGCTDFAELATPAANVTSYVHTGVPFNTVVSYRIRSFNVPGRSAFTSTITGTTVLPPPTLVRATTLNRNTIRVTWADNASFENSYQVERCSGFGCVINSYSVVGSLGANVTTFDNTGLAAGTAYQYRVRASTVGGFAFGAVGASARTPSVLSSPAALAALSDTVAGELHYVVNVPAGARQLVIKMTAGTGDPDMYVRQGETGRANQILNDATNCVPYTGASPEICTFDNPTPGDWFIMLQGFSAHTGTALDVSVPGDFVLFNDLNGLDDGGMGNPNNVQFARNLVQFAGAGFRASGNTVYIDRGRASPASSFSLATLTTTWQGLGFVVTTISSSSGTLTSIPSNVKLLVLHVPITAFTAPEAETIRLFIKQGGRVLYVGESGSYLGLPGRATLDGLLSALGSGAVHDGLGYDGGYTALPAANIRADQLTTSMTGITWAFGGGITLGVSDKAIAYNSANVVPWMAVIRILFP